MEGGSGKVVDSKPNDRIFLYYSDHGGPGVLGEKPRRPLLRGIPSYFVRLSNNSGSLLGFAGMPNMPFLYAAELIEVLKRKHAMGGYGEMVGSSSSPVFLLRSRLTGRRWSRWCMWRHVRAGAYSKG